jgi:hypothetical protein
VFVYTREAHPGEDVPHHNCFEAKLACARLLRDETGIRRPILVDDLAGAAHRRYGSMPNMTWVIDRGGIVAYKANWTSAANVEAFVVRYLAAKADREHGAMARYETEQVEFRQVDRESFTKRLLRNGPRAAEEFRQAGQVWAQRG